MTRAYVMSCVSTVTAGRHSVGRSYDRASNTTCTSARCKKLRPRSSRRTPSVNVRAGILGAYARTARSCRVCELSRFGILHPVSGKEQNRVKILLLQAIGRETFGLNGKIDASAIGWNGDVNRILFILRNRMACTNI